MATANHIDKALQKFEVGDGLTGPELKTLLDFHAEALEILETLTRMTPAHGFSLKDVRYKLGILRMFKENRAVRPG